GPSKEGPFCVWAAQFGFTLLAGYNLGRKRNENVAKNNTNFLVRNVHKCVSS
ncbi:MAG: hypothetical protein ACI8WM_003360, partial [Burkholderiaceae bacterium]